VRRLRQLLAGLDLAGYCWITLFDPTRHAGTEHVFQQRPEFTSLGLLAAGCAPKPAWVEWLALAADASGPAGAGVQERRR
jgi:hypothetical protein